MAYYIGIDLGTSSVKLILIDETGKILKQTDRKYQVNQPRQGWKEIDPELWWESTASALEELLEGVEKNLIESIGITGQMHTLVVLDGNGKPVRPALMWNDTRTGELIPRLKQWIADSELSYLKHTVSTGGAAANLLWMKESEPEQYGKIKHFLIGPDYLVYRMTGIFGTDYCEASTSLLFNFKKKEWSDQMRIFLELPRQVYPEIRGSAQTVGNILPEIAERFGFDCKVSVIAGTGDNPAAAIPTGCLSCNYPVLSLGTSGVLMFPREEPDFTAKGKNILVSFDGDIFHTLVQGVIQSCGSGYSWWNRDILRIEDMGYTDQEIDLAQLGENDLIFCPHLVGDKAIYANPDFRGAFIGLGTDTSRTKMTLAVMEGIAYGIRQLIEEMHLECEQLTPLQVIGGGAKNRVWMQILANVLQLEIIQMEGYVGAGYGIALLAAYKCKTILPLETLNEKVMKTVQNFVPVEVQAKKYDQGFDRYKRICDFLNELYYEKKK